MLSDKGGSSYLSVLRVIQATEKVPGRIEQFARTIRGRFQQGAPGAMLTASIARAYREATEPIASIPGSQRRRTNRPFDHSKAHRYCSKFLMRYFYGTTNYGMKYLGRQPSWCAARPPFECWRLPGAWGSLTATIHGTRRDFEENRPLVAVLARKAGRLIFDGFPTGVEVCPSMQHGGPYPATSDPRFTSVATAAIQRFSRPVCFQDCPLEFLPPELQAFSK